MTRGCCVHNLTIRKSLSVHDAIDNVPLHLIHDRDRLEGERRRPTFAERQADPQVPIYPMASSLR